MSISLAIPAHAGNRIPKREAPSQTTLNQSTQETLYYVIPFAHPVPENGRARSMTSTTSLISSTASCL